MRPLCAAVRGWGGKALDQNIDLLMRRLAAIEIEVLDCLWDHSGDTVANIRKKHVDGQQVYLVGVSCGANVLAWIATELQKLGIRVNYAAWIQPSRWCVSGWMPPIPSNVSEAFIVYGSCWTTLGFGCYKPPLVHMPSLIPPDKSLYDGKVRIGNGGMTKVRWQYINDLHPADFDIKGVQDPILRDIIRIKGHPLEATTLMRAIPQ